MSILDACKFWAFGWRLGTGYIVMTLRKYGVGRVRAMFWKRIGVWKSGLEYNFIQFMSSITADVWYHVRRISAINAGNHPHRSIDSHSCSMNLNHFPPPPSPVMPPSPLAALLAPVPTPLATPVPVSATPLPAPFAPS